MRRDRKPYSLVGIDGNAFSIIAYTMQAMRECGFSKDAMETYKGEVLSGDYDTLLSLSIGIIDRCNIALGYDEFQLLMKGHDGLEYVEGKMTGNRVEKLINENFNLEDCLYSDEFKYNDLENDNAEKYENFRFDVDSDYFKLYNALLKNIKSILNQQLLSNYKFTKTEIKQILLGEKPAVIGIIDDPDFWEYIEYLQEIPKYSINEEANFISNELLKRLIKSRILKVIILLIDVDDIKFSKYDVYHAFLLMITSGELFTNLIKYVPD